MGGGPHIGSHFASNFGSQRAAFGARSFAYPIPFFTDSLYSDAIYAPGYAGASPAVLILQGQSPAPAEPERPASPVQPLLIELQGNRYVRLSGDETSGAQIIDSDSLQRESSEHGSSQKARLLDVAAPATPVREPVPALLVFRDGHREEVSDYTIAVGILYARSDDFSSGAWNKKIELSALNLPETVATNRSRGVKFRLPRASNEVIVGP